MRTAKMSLLFIAYAKRKGLDPNALRFLLDGQRIGDDETAITLELENKDHINCVLARKGRKKKLKKKRHRQVAHG